MSCDGCEMLTINGIPTHEIGCPEAWRDEVRECLWCGQKFKPEHKNQTCCDDDCEGCYSYNY